MKKKWNLKLQCVVLVRGGGVDSAGNERLVGNREVSQIFNDIYFSKQNFILFVIRLFKNS